MTDRMLSAEKVYEYLDSKRHTPAQSGAELLVNTVLLEIKGAVACGQLDADCPKCGGSGFVRMRYKNGSRFTLNCDCGSESVKFGGADGEVVGVDECPAGKQGGER